MAAMSNYLENKLIDHIFRGISYTPSTIAIALLKAAPDDTSTGGTIIEVDAPEYERIEMGPDASLWTGTHGNISGPSSGTNGTTENAVAVEFAAATSTWGSITHVAIMDSLTVGTGNVLFWGSLNTSKTISVGDRVRFEIGRLDIRLDN
jgi:hypothetical protein